MKVVVALLLFCHVTSATAVVPFFVTMLAAVDGSHSVIVEYNGSGAGVRLHHRADDFTPCSYDHHSLAGRVAATLCGSAQTDGDHVLAPASASPTAEVKKRDAFAAEAAGCVAGAADLPASVSAQILELFRGVLSDALTAESDSRRHLLQARQQALASVILLV